MCVGGYSAWRVQCVWEIQCVGGTVCGGTVCGLSLIEICERTRVRRISYAVFCVKRKRRRERVRRDEVTRDMG